MKSVQCLAAVVALIFVSAVLSINGRVAVAQDAASGSKIERANFITAAESSPSTLLSSSVSASTAAISQKSDSLSSVIEGYDDSDDYDDSSDYDDYSNDYGYDSYGKSNHGYNNYGGYGNAYYGAYYGGYYGNLVGTRNIPSFLFCCPKYT